MSMAVRKLIFAIAVGSVALPSCKTDPIRASSGDGATALADAAPKPGPVNVIPVPKDLVE